MDLQHMDWDFKDLARDNDIVLQGYRNFYEIFQAEKEKKDVDYMEWVDILHTLCAEIQEDQGITVTPSQLILRFMIENDIAVIPKSTKTQHLKENQDIFQFEFTNDLNVRLGGRDVEKEEL